MQRPKVGACLAHSRNIKEAGIAGLGRMGLDSGWRRGKEGKGRVSVWDLICHSEDLSFDSTLTNRQFSAKL